MHAQMLQKFRYGVLNTQNVCYSQRTKADDDLTFPTDPLKDICTSTPLPDLNHAAYLADQGTREAGQRQAQLNRAPFKEQISRPALGVLLLLLSGCLLRFIAAALKALGEPSTVGQACCLAVGSKGHAWVTAWIQILAPKKTKRWSDRPLDQGL